MAEHEQVRGQGAIETRAGEEIPVFYDMVIEYETIDGDRSPSRMSGRLRIMGHPWLETTVIAESHFLVLEDGTRLRVRVDPGGRNAETLPFRAALPS